MATATETRESGTRAKSVRKWTPPSLLPIPPDNEDWVHRWVRSALMGVSDPTNMSSRMREGWEPVSAEACPEIVAQLALDANKRGHLEVGGLILCRMPREMNEQRKAYYASLTKQQMAAVDSELFRDNDPRMPMFKESSSKVSKSRFGDGSI